MIRPLKVLPFIGQVYLKIERGIEAAVAKRYGLTYPWPKKIRIADEQVAHAEVAKNIKSKVDAIHYDKLLYDRNTENPHGIEIYCWRPELAEAFFLDRFKDLAKQRGIDLQAA